MSSLAREHLKIFCLGSLIAFVWESYQMPFFEPGDLMPYEQSIRCGVASLGDGLILVGAYWLPQTLYGVDWLRVHSRPGYTAYFLFGLFVAVLVEVVATSIPQASVISWRYSTLMPMIPGINLAIVPIAMWIIVPAMAKLPAIALSTARLSINLTRLFSMRPSFRRRFSVCLARLFE